VLVPFGGAGPLHAARIAEELGIDTLCVPAHAGVLSAYGLLASDYVRFETRTQRTTVDSEAPGTVKRTFARLEAEARTALDALGLGAGIRFTHSLDMRYVGQAFEVPVELTAADLTDLSSRRLLDLFNEAHHRVFAFDDSRVNAAEIISYRLGAAVSPGAIPVLTDDATAPVDGETTIVDRGDRLRCRLLNRRAVAGAGLVRGPALVEDTTSTAYLPAGWTARLDPNHNLIMTRGNEP
jgi:N-methylhydantoinase A